ncbi:hypothetical protein [Mycobacterium sp. URHB0021]
MRPTTSAEIASVAGLDERYVRVTGRNGACSDYDPTTHTHHLPVLVEAGGSRDAEEPSMWRPCGPLSQEVSGTLRRTPPRE